jgi:hypothetical protein
MNVPVDREATAVIPVSQVLGVVKPVFRESSENASMGEISRI